MPQKNLIKMQCEKCKRINYHSRRNKKAEAGGERLELKKFCKWCKEHLIHKEMKK